MEHILDVVCDQLKISRETILSASRLKEIVFARCLFTLLAKEKGCNMDEAMKKINKTRVMQYSYLMACEDYLEMSTARFEIYKKCAALCEIKPREHRKEKKKYPKEVPQKVTQHCQTQKYKSPICEYTIEEEFAIKRAIRSANEFMKNYGKGQQPSIMFGDRKFI